MASVDADVKPTYKASLVKSKTWEDKEEITSITPTYFSLHYSYTNMQGCRLDPDLFVFLITEIIEYG